MTATGAQGLREVRLYGALGRQFGRVFRLAVATPAEAVRALRAVLPGFERAFVGSDGRQAYHVFVGRQRQRRDVAEEELQQPLGSDEPIRLVPVVAGAKNGGLFQTVLGVALIAAGLVLTAYGYGAVGQYAITAGVSMVLSGVVQLLSPQRKNKDPTTNQPSYAFDGPVNNVEQGGPVPVIFGRVMTGSVVVSQGLSTEDLVVVGPPPPPIPVPPRPVYEPLDPYYYQDPALQSTGG